MTAAPFRASATQPSPRGRVASSPRSVPSTRRRLELVPARQPGPPLVRLVVAVVVLASLGLMGVLALHTFLAQDAYRLHDAQREAALLKAQEETLARQVDSLNDPGVLATKARKLGMVPGGTPVFLRPDGKTLGASLPKGDKVAFPKVAPSNGMVIVGTPTPTASPNPNPSGQPTSGAAGSAKPSARPTPAVSGAPR